MPIKLPISACVREGLLPDIKFFGSSYQLERYQKVTYNLAWLFSLVLLKICVTKLTDFVSLTLLSFCHTFKMASDERVEGSRSQQTRDVEDGPTTTPPRHGDSFFVGIMLLLLVVLLWTASNFLTNYQL